MRAREENPMSKDGNGMDEKDEQAGNHTDNPEEHVRLLGKTAELGDPVAQFQLGWHYTSGQGVPQDYEKAAHWYLKAAEQGIVEAQHNLGACYAKRMNSHVCFGIIYDSLTLKRQLIVRIIGNGIILIAFCIALYPSYDYVNFMKFQKSTVVRIPFNIAYSPFLVFLVLILGRTVRDLTEDIRKLVKAEA